MTNIRRHFQEGSIFFLTHVTADRRPLLVANYDLWESALRRTHTGRDFNLLAWVVLPDHVHMVIEPGGHDLSELMRKLKLSFSGQYRHRFGVTSGRVWQNRFWDHIIRDQNDLNRHIDYIHYNPVKHGQFASPFDWPFSSIHEYRRNGVYEADWGRVTPEGMASEFGE